MCLQQVWMCGTFTLCIDWTLYREVPRQSSTLHGASNIDKSDLNEVCIGYADIHIPKSEDLIVIMVVSAVKPSLVSLVNQW